VDQLLSWAEPFEKRTTGRLNKNDPNDAHSIAIAALRAPALRSVEPADHGEVLRLLSKRNSDLERQRSRVVCRLHFHFAELSPGGIVKEMYVSDAEAKKRFAHSSVRSPTPSTASSCSTPKGVREDTGKRLVACVAGSAS
jgi:hypothetical protein